MFSSGIEVIPPWGRGILDRPIAASRFVFQPLPPAGRSGEMRGPAGRRAPRVGRPSGMERTNTKDRRHGERVTLWSPVQITADDGSAPAALKNLSVAGLCCTT